MKPSLRKNDDSIVEKKKKKKKQGLRNPNGGNDVSRFRQKRERCLTTGVELEMKVFIFTDCV
jgi:hypothetical protein